MALFAAIRRRDLLAQGAPSGLKLIAKMRRFCYKPDTAISEFVGKCCSAGFGPG
jgi:hypothetical protein